MAATRKAEPYCVEDDVNLGDIQTPRVVVILDWIKSTADEIDADIGQIYQLPLTFNLAQPEDRADALLLKKINSFLATGRIIATASSAAQDAQLNAYAKLLLGEAKSALAKIVKGEVVLESAVRIVDSDTQYNGPLYINKDKSSFVDGFYSSAGSGGELIAEWNVGISG